MHEVLTVAEVAQHLRCSKAHVYNLINGSVRGVSQLPAIALGRRKLVRKSTLESWEGLNEQPDACYHPGSGLDAV